MTAADVRPGAAPAGAMSTPGRQTDFDQVADEYDASLPAHAVEHYLRKRLAYIAAAARPGRALDVGSGTGLLAERLAGTGWDVVALDPSRGMLGHLRRRRPGFAAVAGGGEALPFPDGAFDLAYCVAVMHHVAEPELVRRTLSEMARVVRPGGHVLVWDHNPNNPYWPLLMKRVPQDTGAERLIPAGEIATGLAVAGARPVRVAQLGWVPDFLPAPLLPLVSRLETVAEATPGLRRFGAHNVVLAVKGGA